MVSVDPYLNETSRHADVVLPPPPPSQSPHYDFAFNTLAVRNQVRYTRPRCRWSRASDESEILARPADPRRAGCTGPTRAPSTSMVIGPTLAKAVADPHSPVHGRDPRELAAGSPAAPAPSGGST